MGSTSDCNLSMQTSRMSRVFRDQKSEAPSRNQQDASGTGLSTQRALKQLHDDIELEILRMRDEISRRKLFFWLAESVSFESELSKMRWPSVLFMIIQAVAHFVIAFVLDVGNPATNWVGFQGFILLAMLLFNLGVNFLDTKLRSEELLMKSERISQLIDQCSRDKHLLRRWRQLSWKSAKAKTLFTPKSPCIHQTLTYRDNSCLNLPDYLLVKGDVIHLFPGEQAPADCVSLNFNDRENPRISLGSGDIFIPTGLKEKSDSKLYRAGKEHQNRDIAMQFSRAKLRRSNQGTDFLIRSTPYVESLRISLQRSHRRPVNSVEKECFIVSRKYFETLVIPLIFVLSTTVTAIHYGYLDLTDSDQKIKTISVAHLLLRPSLTIMPFLPWMFPSFWLAVNAYGSARLISSGELQRQRPANVDLCGLGQSPDSQIKSQRVAMNQNLLATPITEESKHHESSQDPRDANHLRSTMRIFFDLLWGSGGHVWRSSNLLQVLGCLTSLCCIDKVGILSGSNPTPEKVFTLIGDEETRSSVAVSSNLMGRLKTPRSQISKDKAINHESHSNLSQACIGGQNHEDQASSTRTSVITAKHTYHEHAKIEILDVSQTVSSFQGSINDSNTGQCSQLQFDDLHWHKYIDNLKPLGLTILMNNCCEASFADYFRFYKHISCQSILQCNLTPVVKRRCICSLAKLIGFSKDANYNYNYVNQIGLYKMIDPKAMRSGKLMSNLDCTARLKLPFSNMTCNIHQDTTTGSFQLFSQGTADMVLDACVEYWDGRQLVPLGESARKKIMDFYHRTSLTSYCTAFAYTPLIERRDLGNYYIELPQKNCKFAPYMRKLANEQQEKFLNSQLISLPHRNSHLHELEPDELHLPDPKENPQQTGCRADLYENRLDGDLDRVLRRHLSMEEIWRPSDIDALSSQTIRPTKMFQEQLSALNETLDELTDQVFVGMVAMQYQVCPDFVALVEQLEHACIRFVHFSKENELRSRVFSEKMGLESGWNCHISLQSDQDLNEYGNKQVDRTFTGPSESLVEQSPSVEFAPSHRIATIFRREADAAPDWRDPELGSLGSVSILPSEKRSLQLWRSLPSLVMQIIAKMSPKSHAASTPDHQQNGRALEQVEISSSSVIRENVASDSDYGDAQTNDLGAERSSENSVKSEGFEALAFDMSNRAKLPKGIENIRPHLETVDNVPLQVSLFTDCTPELTKEMIEIMQDYGEIVCVIGSSASKMNTSVFLQANASIAIEPLMPSSCTRSDNKRQRSMAREMSRNFRKQGEGKSHKPAEDKSDEPATIDVRLIRPNNPRDRLGIGPVQVEANRPNVSGSNRLRDRPSSSASVSSSFTSSSSSSSSFHSSSSEESDGGFSDENDTADSLLSELPGPMALASKLASLPCSYSYRRKEHVNLYSLIMEARHFTFKMKNTFVCMICFALSISSAQFLASLLFLPPMLSSGLTIWLTVVVVPLLSFSLMSTTMDTQVMKIAVGKNLQLKPENITFFVICYLIKFIPSIIVVVFSFGLIIAHSCKLTGFGSSSLGPCWMFTYVQHANSTSTDQTDQDILWSSHLLTAQVCAAFLLVLYFVVISAGFVHRSHLMWERSPIKNRLWVFISLTLIFGQLLYNQLVLQVNLNSSSIPYEFLASLPARIWLISFVSPILVMGVNLLVKRAEIKATIRQQRRARFDFNTKLGMNSPF